MPLLRLGRFVFEAAGPSYEAISKNYTYEWTKQKRLRSDNTLYWAGIDAYTINLSGTVYPESLFRGRAGNVEQFLGTESLTELRRMGDSGQSWSLVDGVGRNLGKWVIKSFDINEEMFFENGLPRKQKFTLQLEKDLKDSRTVEDILVDQNLIRVTQNNTFVERARDGLSTTNRVVNEVGLVVDELGNIISGGQNLF